MKSSDIPGYLCRCIKWVIPTGGQVTVFCGKCGGIRPMKKERKKFRNHKNNS